MVEIPAVAGPKDGPLPLAVWIGLGGTGAAALATTVFGLVALDKRDTYASADGKSGHTRAELRSLRDDAQLWETLTDVGLGLSIAGAGTTVALYFLLDRDDGGEHTPAAAWAPLPGGGLFVLGGAL